MEPGGKTSGGGIREHCEFTRIKAEGKFSFWIGQSDRVNAWRRSAGFFSWH